MMTYRYANPSQTIKVIRVSNIPGFYLERTAFPGQVIQLQVPLGTVLEVYAAPVTTLCEDTIRCSEDDCCDQVSPKVLSVYRRSDDGSTKFIAEVHPLYIIPAGNYNSDQGNPCGCPA